MPSQAEERFLDALRGVLGRAVNYHGERVEYAVVTSADPLEVELTKRRGDVLTDDELSLGHSVRQYHEDYGLDEGDTLVLHLGDDDDYVAVDVLHDKTVTPSAEAS